MKTLAKGRNAVAAVVLPGIFSTAGAVPVAWAALGGSAASPGATSDRNAAPASTALHRRRPRFRRRAARRFERVVHRLAARLPSRRRGLRRWLPLGH